MKKLLSILFVFTLIACGGGSDDDEESIGRTTDPFIGTWQTNDGGEIVTIINNSNGTSSISYTDEIGGGTGTWRNTSNNPNFNSLIQVYVFEEGTEDESSETVNFASDFSTWTCAECSLWVRQ